MSSRKRFLKALTAVCAGLGLAGAAQAVEFDATGTATFDGTELQRFDWDPGNSLARGGVEAIESFNAGGDDTQFDLFYQATLGLFREGGSNFQMPAGTELTIVVGARERVIGTTDNSATFEFVDDNVGGTGAADWLEIYFDETADADDLAGTGFNNGTLILKADVTNINQTTFTVEDPTPVPLDQTTGDPDGVNNDYPDQFSVTGNGETQGTAQIVFFDPNFFNFIGGPGVIDFTLLQNVGLSVPFGSVDPSSAFVFEMNDGTGDGPSPTPAGAGISLGDVNGLTGEGPDFQFQTDANQTFREQQEPGEGIIPEPATAAMGLLSLGAVALASRRRRHSA